MLESLNNYLPIIALYFPLGLIGIWRWGVWVLKKTVAQYYQPTKSGDYQTTLSVVTPVYNEDPKLFRRALESWQQNNPEEIIAVIDDSDKVCIEEFKDFANNANNAKLIITTKPGKRPALADGVKVATAEVVALVDSDTVWDKNIRTNILAPFVDPSVGGVGTRQDVLETKTLAQRLFNIHLDQRYFDEMPFLAKSSDALTCLSGRTALYRRKAIIDLVDDMVNETFWGKRCISGEDKCLTRLVQTAGWKTRYQMNVCVRTHGMFDLSTFFRQQTRWIRNSWRSDLKSLTSGWIWRREKVLAFHMVDRFIQPLTLILGPIYFILSIIWGHWLVAAILLVWWHFSRAIKIYPHLKHRPSDLLILPAYILSTYIIGIIKIYDLFTINKQGWITRWDKNRLERRGYFELLFAYLGTVVIISSLGFGVISYRQALATFEPIVEISKNVKFSGNDEAGSLAVADCGPASLIHYLVEPNDTLSMIARKYNSDLFVIIEANKETLPNPDYLKIGQLITIPISELGQALEKNKLFFLQEPEITFDESTRTISVEGRGSVVTLSKINAALNSESTLEKLNDKEWLLKANLLIKKGVTLIIDDDDTVWLKLQSDKNGFVWLQSNSGSLLIKNTKITSWDVGNLAPDTNYGDGRSYISVRQNGRLDILNSELSFLGYADSLTSGVTWHTTGNRPDNYLLTGQVLDSEFYNNYSGLYLSGAAAVSITNNEIARNIEYGINIRNDANNLLIKNNWLHNNGNYNLIVPRGCFNNALTFGPNRIQFN